jgi:hypothetical protein
MLILEFQRKFAFLAHRGLHVHISRLVGLPWDASPYLWHENLPSSTPTYHNANRINAIRISAAPWFAEFKWLPREVIYHCSTIGSISLATKRNSTVMTTYSLAWSRDNSSGYGLDDGVRFSAGARDFSLLHTVQNGSGTHTAFSTMNTRGSSPGGKAAGVWNWSLTCI